MFFDKNGSIRRLTVTSTDTDKEDYQQVVALQGFPLNIQPASPEETAISEGLFGKTYNVFTTHSGIQVGDRLTVSGTFVDNKTQNKELEISGLGNWHFGPIPHFEIIAMEINE